MQPLSYKDATFDNLPKIVEIYNSTIASRMVTADTEPVTIESRVEWFKKHQPQRPLWIVNNEQNNIVGWVSFQRFYGRPAYNATAEISIYIDEKERSKGLGKQILEYSINAAPGFGIKTLLGFIFAHNEPSLKLFRHFGFEDWATLPDVAILDGVERSLKILGKRVA
jgi:phosphinothricin acetyltransferase